MHGPPRLGGGDPQRRRREPVPPTTLTLSSDSARAEGGDAVTLTAALNRVAPATAATVTLNGNYTLSSTTITIARYNRMLWIAA